MNDSFIYKEIALGQHTSLKCPGCEEELSQVDIGSFGKCPYCNYELEQTNDLEDYLLQPAISHWIHTEVNNDSVLTPEVVISEQ